MSFNNLTTLIAVSLTARDVNQAQLATTRRETVRGGSTPASLRVTVSARCYQSMSPGIVCGTAVGTRLISPSKQRNFYFVNTSNYPQTIMNTLLLNPGSHMVIRK